MVKCSHAPGQLCTCFFQIHVSRIGCTFNSSAKAQPTDWSRFHDTSWFVETTEMRSNSMAMKPNEQPFMKCQYTPFDKYGALLEASVRSISTDARAPTSKTCLSPFCVPTNKYGPVQDMISCESETVP